MRLLSMLCFMVLVCFGATEAFAQSALTGKITDSETGEPIPNANVFILESQRGGISDIDGIYKVEGLEAGNYTVRVSFIGYQTYEEKIVLVDQDYLLNVALDPDLNTLDEVVVSAFGMSRSEKSTGNAVQKVDASDLAMVPSNNVVGSLTGKVAGVQVINSSGANPGGSSLIRLRGVTGFGDTQPLFVVDGTPINNQSFSASDAGRDYGNLAGDIDMDNVESVTVLKGAAASALYGQRAANGVILITTKSGKNADGLGVTINSRVLFDQVYVLPDYQNEYAGGYTQDFLKVTPDGRSLSMNDAGQYTLPNGDVYGGEVQNALNYAADESWGPKMDGTEYRPWWSWFPQVEGDFGRTIPLKSNKDNVRDFFETGVRFSNNISLENGNRQGNYRLSVSSDNITGVMPNNKVDVTGVAFNGSLNHSKKFTSSISLNYANTKGRARPNQGYSPTQGNPIQSFNQWFQRQLAMDKLKNYRLSDGTIASWNINSATNPTPLYWDSPYFTVYENASKDERNRLFGNFTLDYEINDNLKLTGRIHMDTYDFSVQERIGSGGLELDYYKILKRSRREMNYELLANYDNTFGDFSVQATAGLLDMKQTYNSSNLETVGGLSVPNFYNINASIDRPSDNSYNMEKEIRSVLFTSTVGWKDIVYLELTARNDWSSALPVDNNSYLYYGISGSVILTELGPLKDNDILSFWKIRSSLAQVGKDMASYGVNDVYSVGTPYGSTPTMTLPNTLYNPNLKPAINSDFEIGTEARFLSGRVRTDINYFNSVREDEILDLNVPGSTGYDYIRVNAGKFVSEGVELTLGGTAVESRDLTVDFTLNWAKTTSRVEKLIDGLDQRQLERAYWGVYAYATEGKSYGNLVSSGFTTLDGQRVIEGGSFTPEQNKEIGNILPDYTGGFRVDVNYKNFSLGAHIDFQKGGDFYSITKMWNAYSGLGKETVGNNPLGNPKRDPLTDASGAPISSGYINYADAGSNSGGIVMEGVDADGNPVKILKEAQEYYADLFSIKENWIYDQTYVKLREVRLGYTLPNTLLQNTPIKRASVALTVNNAWLIYSSTDGIDPSEIMNGATGYAYWEGGQLPGVRTIGFNVNVSF